VAGAERIVLTLLNNLNRSVFDISVCLFLNAQKPDNPFAEESKHLKVATEIIYLDKVFRWRYVRELAGVLKKHGIDVLHTHGHRADITAYLATRYWNSSLVATIHGWTSSTSRLALYKYIDKQVLKNFDFVIPVSDEIKQSCLRCNVPSTRVQTLRNVIDFSSYPQVHRYHFRQELGIRTDQTLIGTVARLSKEKRLTDFLLVARRILNQRKDVKFAIVGDGPEKAKLVDLAKVLGLTEDVFFCGYIKDISKVYSAIDIFLLTSVSEGIPISLLEAAYFRTPFVATRVGGISEMFDDIAMLVTPGDVNAMVSNILYLINYKTECQSYGDRLREYATRHCTARDWIRTIEEIYLNLKGSER